jgi:hypothetical protein
MYGNVGDRGMAILDGMKPSSTVYISCEILPKDVFLK